MEVIYSFLSTFFIDAFLWFSSATLLVQAAVIVGLVATISISAFLAYKLLVSENRDENVSGRRPARKSTEAVLEELAQTTREIGADLVRLDIERQYTEDIPEYPESVDSADEELVPEAVVVNNTQEELSDRSDEESERSFTKLNTQNGCYYINGRKCNLPKATQRDLDRANGLSYEEGLKRFMEKCLEKEPRDGDRQRPTPQSK